MAINSFFSDSFNKSTEHIEVYTYMHIQLFKVKKNSQELKYSPITGNNLKILVLLILKEKALLILTWLCLLYEDI